MKRDFRGLALLVLGEVGDDTINACEDDAMTSHFVFVFILSAVSLLFAQFDVVHDAAPSNNDAFELAPSFRS